MEIRLHKKSQLALKIALTFFLVVYSIYLVIANPKFLTELETAGILLFQHRFSVWIYLVIGLMFVNWGIEGKKWQLLITHVVKIKQLEAFKHVLIGLTMSFFTPRSLGDYLGRILFLKEENPWQLTGALAIGRLSQLCITLFFGLLSLLFLFSKPLISLLFMTLLMISIVAVLFFCRSFILNTINQFFPKVYQWLKIIKNYRAKDFLFILVLGGIRYLVFSLQFVIILYLLTEDSSPLHWFPYVSLVFLAKSIVPSFNFLSDIGVREYSSIFFLGLGGISPEIALTSSLFIWFINILIPTILGGAMVWKR